MGIRWLFLVHPDSVTAAYAMEVLYIAALEGVSLGLGHKVISRTPTQIKYQGGLLNFDFSKWHFSNDTLGHSTSRSWKMALEGVSLGLGQKVISRSPT